MAENVTNPSANPVIQAVPKKCDSCGKNESQLTNPLKHCAKCRQGSYCSRDCQKADWKNHKKACCKQPAALQPSGNDLSSRRTPTTATRSTPNSSSGNAFQQLSEGKYLHYMSEQDAYRALIDSYRLRVEDEFTFGSIEKEFSTRSENPQPLRGFQRYLDRVEAKARLLPPWWSVEKRQACESLAQDRNQWSCIFFSAEKSDIIEFYKNSMKPMLLRMFAEEVEGWNVSGQGGGTGADIAVRLAQTGLSG